MLNPFPDLLALSFFAPTLLRMAAAFIFGFIAYTQWRRFEELSRITYPIIGSGSWTVLVFILINCLSAIGLLLGLLTQIAAILGMLIALKLFVWWGRYPRVMVLERLASFLLFFICLSLLITGAGAFAIDIPL